MFASKKKSMGVMIVAILIIIALFPHRQPCGAPGYSCATAPDEQGIYRTFDDIQPSIVSTVEYILDTDVPLYYRRYTQHRSVN